MKPNSPRSFFVSYSRKDADVVHPVVQMMRATGSRVFRDQENIPPGARWRDVLDQSLQDADVVVVFWSKKSAVSAEVAAEYHEAVRLGKDIIPVLLDDQALSPVLSEFQFIDFRPMTCAGSPWYYVLECLAQTIIRRVNSGLIENNPVIISPLHDIFIAHTSSGEREAKDIGRNFPGLNVFYWDISKTEPSLLSSETYIRMRRSRIVLLVISANDVHTPQVADVGTALAYMPVRSCPVLINCDRAELPHDLGIRYALDFDNRNEWQYLLTKWLEYSQDTQGT